MPVFRSDTQACSHDLIEGSSGVLLERHLGRGANRYAALDRLRCRQSGRGAGAQCPLTVTDSCL
jgi:hypothetical protein